MDSQVGKWIPNRNATFFPSWCGAQGRFGPSTLAYTDHNNGTVTVAVGTRLAGKHPLQITLWAAQMSLFRKPFWDILRIFFFRSPELFNLRAWLMAVGDFFGDFFLCSQGRRPDFQHTHTGDWCLRLRLCSKMMEPALPRAPISWQILQGW